MENQKSTVSASLTYGLLLSLVLIVFSLLMYLLDIKYDSKIMWLSYLIITGGLLWAMISYRDKHAGGFISYGKAFGTGFWTGLFAAILSAIFTYIYVSFINTGLIEQILMDSEDKILQSNPNISDEELEMALSWTEKFTTPITMAIGGFLASVVFSTVASLIIAIFVKREKPQEFNEEEVNEAS